MICPRCGDRSDDGPVCSCGLPAGYYAEDPDDDPGPLVYGFCYGCRREVPLTVGSGFKIARHAHPDGMPCSGAGRKAGYVCSPPDHV